MCKSCGGGRLDYGRLLGRLQLVIIKLTLTCIHPCAYLHVHICNVIIYFVARNYVIKMEHVTWQQANDSCVDLGMKLLEPRSELEYNDAVKIRSAIGEAF